MSRAVAVGERSYILGFKGVGFEIGPVENAEELTRTLAALARDRDAGLILVTESMAAEAPGAIDHFREAANGGILCIIPTHKGSNHLSFDRMRAAVEHAIGVDVLGKD